MEKNIGQTISRLLPWLIIAFGIILRLEEYFLNRSLWLDEAFVATNFIDRAFWGLLQSPLDYAHMVQTPPGFLLTTKLAISVFGNSDLILRLFPFVCGIASLILFLYMAKAWSCAWSKTCRSTACGMARTS